MKITSIDKAKGLLIALIALSAIACSGKNKTESQDAAVQEQVEQTPTPTTQAPVEEEKPEDKVVAIVNGVEIPRTKFDEEFEKRTMQFVLKQTPVPEAQKVKYQESVLKTLIEEELINQYLANNPIEIDELQFKEAFDKEKAKYGSPQNFEMYLSRTKKTEAEIRDVFLAEYQLEKSFEKQPTFVISDESLKLSYEKIKSSRFYTPERIRASYIFRKLHADADKNETNIVKKEAQRIADLAKKKDADFAKLAIEHGEDNISKMGGDLGLFVRKGIPKINNAFDEAVFKLELNQISEPFQTELGFHIAKKIDQNENKIRAAHILIKLKGKPSKAEVAEAKEKIQKIYEEAIKGTQRFQVLATIYSEDLATKDQGGDLGFFAKGGEPRISKVFEDTAFSLKLGQVSDPIKDSNGFYIIKVFEKHEEVLKSYEEAKDELVQREKERLMRTFKSKLIFDLRKSAKIEEILKFSMPKPQPIQPVQPVQNQ